MRYVVVDSSGIVKGRVSSLQVSVPKSFKIKTIDSIWPVTESKPSRCQLRNRTIWWGQLPYFFNQYVKELKDVGI